MKCGVHYMSPRWVLKSAAVAQVGALTVAALRALLAGTAVGAAERPAAAA